ncbi:MAG: carboxyl-terminal processing protease [Solirubrobacteraceae bacterium]|jgi:carboxyl-terminal processing protease|nr:carboxyl-terminal processing protease [Solirubrobacteraceae bacterium]MEA2225353.1 carboxyl-terminal processing protease [Solirubrobacteraceae bacterium]MEA2335536.1 carboxyl-terminal processing protease [Solirubrobacteraceae bacterium]
MPSGRRHSRLAALVAALPILLILGVYLGGHPEDLPGFARSAFVADHETRVVDEAISRIASDYYRPVPKGRLTNASIAGAVASLGDRFSHYLTPREFREFNQPPSFTGIGVSVAPDRRGLRIARVFDRSPAARAGLRAGDLIVMADGHRLAGLSAEKAIALVKGPPGTDVKLGIERKQGGHTVLKTLTLTRATIAEPVVASATKAFHGVKLGVVALATFSPGAHGEVREGVERELRAGARGIVLDLRANGGGLVEEARLIASIFVEKGTIVSTRGRTQPSETLTATGGAISPKIPVVVLVDGNTASAAEIVTAALQDHHRATVVGTHTFGKGVFQEEEPLSNGGALDITVGQYFTPNGRNLGGAGVKQGAGITPELLVRHGVDSNHGLDVALGTLAAKVK